jgi:hypothetical protein
MPVLDFSECIRDRGRMILYRITLAVDVAVCLGLAVSAAAKGPRSLQSNASSNRRTPCPATGRTSGACPGCIKDHIVPSACGGPDAVSNMQWQATADAKAKDRWEAKGCAC